MKRNEINEKYKWKLDDIYPDLDAFNSDMDAVRSLIEKFPEYESTMTSSPDALADTLEAMFNITRKIEKLYEFAGRSFDVDTSVNEMQALSIKVSDLYRAFGASAYFFTPKLLKLSDKTLSEWYAESPRLVKYRRNIDNERRYKKYTLSPECEKLLAKVNTGIGSVEDIYSILTDCDMTFAKTIGEDGKKCELTDSTYIKFMSSTDRKVRQSAFRKLYAGYSSFGNTIATVINAFVKEKAMLASVRGFKDSLTASTYADEVTPVIYNNLIKTVEKNLDPLYDYYEVKREMLGVDALHMYDLYPPLIAESDREYTYEQAVDEVLDALKIFGDEYYNTLKTGICEKHWIDVYPTDCKRGGAYSAGSYDTEPHILLNFNGKYDDVSTLAHEAGHSMHSYLSRKYNDYNVSEYTIFVAEVASTVNELLLAHKKLRESDSRQEKLAMLNRIMETFKGTLFRQTMFASFEKDIYNTVENGEPLTKDLLCNMYYKTVKKYFGRRVVCDKQIACEWMRIPHFYYNFYVYKYATCISAAAAIVNKIESEGGQYISQYIRFLKSGGSLSPLDSLKIAGIDMSQPDVICAAIGEFESTLNQFKSLL